MANVIRLPITRAIAALFLCFAYEDLEATEMLRLSV
jgi:hypothetical protein